MHLFRPVAYLESTDFDESGALINPYYRRKPVLIMIQSTSCGYCHEAIPDFQRLANQGVVEMATILADGSRATEQALGAMIPKIYPEFQGYPSYMLVLPGGRRIPHEGGRTLKDLYEFVSKHI